MHSYLGAEAARYGVVWCGQVRRYRMPLRLEGCCWLPTVLFTHRGAGRCLLLVYVIGLLRAAVADFCCHGQGLSQMCSACCARSFTRASCHCVGPPLHQFATLCRPCAFPCRAVPAMLCHAVLQLTFTQPHILLLDEPSNHLDIDAVNALIQGLATFKGGVLMVRTGGPPGGAVVLVPSPHVAVFLCPGQRRGWARQAHASVVERWLVVAQVHHGLLGSAGQLQLSCTLNERLFPVTARPPPECSEHQLALLLLTFLFLAPPHATTDALPFPLPCLLHLSRPCP